MTDEEKLEAITSCFVHGLLQYAMNDVEKYAELAERVKNLILCEVEWHKDRNYQRDLMTLWGAGVN